MVSKLTAQFVIVVFIVLTLVAIVLKYALKVDFSLQIYFQYLLLFSVLILLLAKPFIKLTLDLINQPFKQQEKHFKIPYSDIKPKTDKADDQIS
jgi:hypothetical protein